MLLREEMQRILQYLSWQATWWRERAELRTDWSVAVGAGARAYTLKQADWHDRLAVYFRLKWDTPALSTAQELTAVDGLADLFE
jgi:hypothetical protein